MFQSGEEFTKETGKALKDLIHAGLLVFTLIVITVKGDFVSEYVAGISIGLAFTMALTVSYTLVCSVAEMKFQQFSASVIVFTVVYTGKSSYMQSTPSSANIGALLATSSTEWLSLQGQSTSGS
jgi:hypothetical protein